jgi:hypothetical protein
MNKRYLEQYQRLERLYNSVREFALSDSLENEISHQTDSIYYFFVCSYHLRDWISNSGALSNDELKNFFDSRIEMQICRDICNGLKHLVLDERASFGENKGSPFDRTILREYTPLNSMPVKNSDYVIFVGSEKYDVLELVGKCPNLWRDFLKAKKLLP